MSLSVAGRRGQFVWDTARVAALQPDLPDVAALTNSSQQLTPPGHPNVRFAAMMNAETARLMPTGLGQGGRPASRDRVSCAPLVHA